jgi:cytochrome c peroxidase
MSATHLIKIRCATIVCFGLSQRHKTIFVVNVRSSQDLLIRKVTVNHGNLHKEKMQRINKKGVFMKSKIACIAVLCFLFVSYGRVVWSLEQSPPLGLPSIPIPDENPQSQEKIDLGKRLFEDKRFSGDESVSCSTCHKPEKVFTDGLVVAEGIKNKKGTRNTPTVVNAGYYTTEFWDGRRSSLEEQAKDPFVNSVEHGLKDHSPIIKVIRSDSSYPEQFKKVFGIEPDAITIEHVVKAIASFERSLVSGDSPFDRYLYGNDKKAMSESAIRGLSIFRNKGRCVDCHTIGQTSAIFTDNDFHNLGVGFK